MKLPLYYQVYSKLRAQIDSREYPPGSMLPTEQALLEMFNASRAPIRQALGLLENEGLIKRRPGKGTFVTEPPEGLLLWFNFSPFRKLYSKDWDIIQSKAVVLEMRRPPGIAREFLLLGSKEKAIYLERIRYVGECPVIFHQHYLQPALDFNKFKELGDPFSLRGALRDHFSVEITKIEDSLRAVLAPADVAHHLGVDESTPILRAERRSYMKETPIQFDFFYTRTDIWDYNVAFEKGIDGTTSALSVGGKSGG